MRCVWNVDEVYSIEMQVGELFVRKPTREQLEQRRLASTELIILLLNSDLLAKSPYYNSIQVMIPAKNINVLLSKEKVFAWLEKKPQQIVTGVVLDEKEGEKLENFLYGFHPFYDFINQLRAASATATAAEKQTEAETGL
jgi:hypothetical protein